MPDKSIQSCLGQSELHTKNLLSMYKSAKKKTLKEQTKIIEKKTEVFGEVPIQNCAFTPGLYSSSKTLKCANLNSNINKILLKGTVYFKCYKLRHENLSNINVITSNQHRVRERAQTKEKSLSCI